MAHLTTRIKSEVDKVTGAELHCNICDEWKDADQFPTSKARPEQAHKGDYNTLCGSCNTLRNKMKKPGFVPSYKEVREALVSGGLALLATPSLNQAGHKKRDSIPLTDAELALLRERRERREKENTKPDLCYLVGVKGEDKYVKIGHSHDPYARLADFQAGNPRELYVIATLPGGEAKERELHRMFMSYHTDDCVGEWFRKGPAILNEFKGE